MPWEEKFENKIVCGDAKELTGELPSESIDLCITSPPYWGLRCYGVDGQYGLEKTPEIYVAKMVEVFREVKRVLKPWGVCWLNLGDSYASSGGSGSEEYSKRHKQFGEIIKQGSRVIPRSAPSGLKPKDLCGIPWHVAFALQADGWWLRQDIIWAKPNPMPESVQGSRWERHRVKVKNGTRGRDGMQPAPSPEAREDTNAEWQDCPGCPKCLPNDGLVLRMSAGRCTKAHEYVFQLTKSESYYFDSIAIQEKTLTMDDSERDRDNSKLNNTPGRSRMGGLTTNNYTTRNRRSVWTITTKPFKGAHFATFPEDLVVPCIQAGTSERGVCPECGKPWVRVIKPSEEYAKKLGQNPGKGEFRSGIYSYVKAGGKANPSVTAEYKTLGWRPTCSCGKDPMPAIVLDPFMGAGTVGKVAKKQGRSYIGFDLSERYCRMARKRIDSVPDYVLPIPNNEVYHFDTKSIQEILL